MNWNIAVPLLKNSLCSKASLTTIGDKFNVQWLLENPSDIRLMNSESSIEPSDIIKLNLRQLLFKPSKIRLPSEVYRFRTMAS